MALTAPDEPYDEPGHLPSDVPGSEKLRGLEGGGGTSPPDRSWYKPDQQPKDLPEKEKEGSNKPGRHLNAVPDDDKDQVGKGHVEGAEGRVAQAYGRLLGNKKILVGAGGGIFALIVVGGLFLGFLNVFKLDAFMSNIEQRAFLRHNAALSNRSDKWIQSYIAIRLTQLSGPGTDPDSEYFRARKVDTDSPIRDFYRTMRSSKFELDLAKNGIVFQNRAAPDGVKFSILTVNGEQVAGLDAKDVRVGTLDSQIASGDIDILNRVEVDLNKPGAHKEARSIIKKIVYDNTHFFQVYKRRTERKALQNMTGVKDWRFFETTRDKIQAKKIDLRNRMLDKILPDPNNSIVGRITRCVFGVNNCNPSRDTVDPKNLSTASGVLGTEDPNSNQTPEEEKLARSLDEAGFSDALKKILAQANILARVLNVPQTLDMLSYVNKSMSNLVKYVVLARGAQAAGLFQVFETSRDQLKSGQVNPEEVNALMQSINSAASSDGWTKVVNGNGDPSIASTTGSCSQESQAAAEKDPSAHQNDYAPLCEDQRIGNASNGAKLEADYKATIGQVVGPIASAWDSLKSTPGIGQIIGIFEWLGNLINKIFSAVVNAVLSALGLKDDVKTAVEWIFAKLSNFLGLSIIKGYEGAGTIFNWLVQGGAYTAESASRREGAAKTTAASQGATQKQVALYQSENQASQSLKDKLVSLDNPNSLAYKAAFAASSFKASNFLGSISHLFASSASSVVSSLNGHGKAAVIDGYAASKFADIETYDYPQQCYDLDPITAKPLDPDGNKVSPTNVLAVLANPRAYGFDHDPFLVSPEQYSQLNSWSVETNSELFYKTVYDIVGEDTLNVDNLVVQIYNCNLLDNSVRGSIGNLYGYTNDNGLEETSGTITPGTTPPTTCTISGIPYPGQYSQQQLAQIFGDPGTASSHPVMDNNLTSVDFLGHSVQVNKLVAPCLTAVAQEIQTSGVNYVIKDIGCYRYDSNNPPANIGLSSYHTYGAACDINPSTNPFVSGGTASYDMPQQYIDAFNHHGFKWGGTFRNVKDYMHFEWHGVTP